MRGHRFLLPLAALWFVSGAEPAQATRSIEIRPLVAPDDWRRLSEAERRRRTLLTPELARTLEARARRWRSIRDDLTAPGFDRSPYARLRPGAAVPERRPASEAARDGHGVPVRTLRVALIRIDFAADREGTRSTGNGRFDLTPADTTRPPIDRPPRNRPFYLAHLEALKRYFEAQAYDLVRIEGDVWPRGAQGRDSAYTLSDMADLGPWRFSRDIYPAARDMFRLMALAADSQSIHRFADRIPWNDYDRFVFIHAGSDLQSDVHQDSPLDIPSFTIGVDDSDAVVFPDSINRDRPIDRAAVVPETTNQDGFFGAINGVLAHECGHLFFGFLDVYDINSGIPTVGFWSLMDYGNGLGSTVQTPDGEEIFATGFLPPSLDPWHRFRFLLGDQLPVTEIPYGDTTAFRAIERHPDCHRVSLSTDEYVMLENRYLSPAEEVAVDQDDSTRVVLGPRLPDRFEYDALLMGGGILAWHVDESVFPNEFTFPVDTALRVNPDFGLNSNPFRRGLSIIEADGLADLGDLGSPFLLGAPSDPWFRSNNPTLSDTTQPRLIAHTGARPHARLDFLDDPDSVMRVGAVRTWHLAGWPIFAGFPPEGPQLLAVDADGDRHLEVCWAGAPDSLLLGDRFVPNPDSASLSAVRIDGSGLGGASPVFARLDRKPRPLIAAWPEGEDPGGGAPRRGPSAFAVSTYGGAPDTSGGEVWLIDGTPSRLGQPLPGWPAALPAAVTTPPVVAGERLFVGCADGRVYALDRAGAILAASAPPLPGGVVGRLAVHSEQAPTVPAARRGRAGAEGAGGLPVAADLVAAGGPRGDVAFLSLSSVPVESAAGVAPAFAMKPGWPRRLGPEGFDPDFLWLDFGGAENTGGDCHRGALSLVVHHADWLWAYCASSGDPLPGWGRDVGDTIVAGLGAADPDGDGFPEVLTHSVRSDVTFWNVTGHPSPGWPRRGTPEVFPRRFDDQGNVLVERRLTASPPVAADLDADRRAEVVALNVSGIVAALRADGRTPAGWPLATGLAAAGAPVIADLDLDGRIELIAPDHLGFLFGYTVPAPRTRPRAIEWPMVGGGPGRTSALVLPPGLHAGPPGPAPGPLVPGSLMAYPNPARRRPVAFAYTLTEPADVEFRILDTSGHEVASFSRRGRQSDNLETWDPAGLPAGLYVARVRFRGGGVDRTESVPIGILR